MLHSATEPEIDNGFDTKQITCNVFVNLTGAYEIDYIVWNITTVHSF